ncbi:MAG: 2-alkenal reductase [Deltaproteobacteria bacterium]|nr:MAG: 2-alkenal reductase [Deltaproteobacteria bacterium]
MSQRRIVGIDLGTTNTCVAYVSNRVPKVVPSDKGRLVLPSVVALTEKGDIVVGNVAKDQRVVNPKQTIVGHKRFIGRPFSSPFVQELKDRFSYEIVEGPGGSTAVRLGGRLLSLPEVSALILAHVKTVAEQFLGGPVDEAVIAVPAYYNDTQRSAVKEAGQRAGFAVRRIVNEPTAAAIAYGFNRGFDNRILVYDLGGGTFDVSILELHGNVFQVVATGGDTFLGGADFDARIVEYVLEEFEKAHRIDLRDDPVVMQRIESAAEAAKIDLSLLSNVVIRLPYVTERKGRPIDLQVPLTREKFNALTRDLVERTVTVCNEVLSEVGLGPREVEEVILVGGQTRMPLVQGRIHQHFGRPPRKGIHPDECVALGAALLADSLTHDYTLTLVDVLSMPVGIAAPGGRFKKVLDKNETIPREKTFALPPPRNAQGEVELDIFQGESDRIVDNEYLGSVRFPRGVSKVTFRLDEECLLHVIVEQGGHHQEVTLVTRDAPESLKRAWAEEMERRRLEAEMRRERSEARGLLSSIRRVFRGKEKE